MGETTQESHKRLRARFDRGPLPFPVTSIQKDMAKKDYKRTPAGIFEWPRVTGDPDTKYKAEGEWRIKVRYDNPADVAHIVAEVDAAMEAEMEAAKARRAEEKKKEPKKAFKPLKFADKPYIINEETGAVTLSFKMTASGISKKTSKPWSMRPAVFGANGQPLAADVKVGGGTRGSVAYELGVWDKPIGVGASLRLGAVQVLELVEFGQRSAAEFGFGNEEPDDEGTAEQPAVDGAGENPGTDDF